MANLRKSRKRRDQNKKVLSETVKKKQRNAVKTVRQERKTENVYIYPESTVS